jgi:hypothetical protein
MSIVLLVYLASIVNDVKSVAGATALSLVAVWCTYYWIICMQNDLKCTKNEAKHFKKTLVLFTLLGFINVFTPTEKTIYIMAGASIAQDIANSPKTAATLDKVYKIVDKKLDEQLSEGIDKATKKMEGAAK